MSLLTPHEEREGAPRDRRIARRPKTARTGSAAARGALLEHAEERAELGGSKLVRGEDVERGEGRGEEVLEHGLVQGDAHAAAAPEKIEAEERREAPQTRPPPRPTPPPPDPRSTEDEATRPPPPPPRVPTPITSPTLVRQGRERRRRANPRACPSPPRRARPREAWREALRSLARGIGPGCDPPRLRDRAPRRGSPRTTREGSPPWKRRARSPAPQPYLHPPSRRAARARRRRRARDPTATSNALASCANRVDVHLVFWS